MSALGDPFLLTSTKSLIGITNCHEFSALLITQNENSVSLYQTEDKKLLKTWVFKHGNKLTSPAIYNAIDKSFLVVQNGKILRTWKFDDDDINSSKKIKFASTIQCILTRGEDEPLILFDNGWLRPVNEAINSSKDVHFGGWMMADDVIEWVESLVVEGKSITLLVTKSKNNKEVLLHIVSCRHQGISDRFSITLQQDSVAYCSKFLGKELRFVCLDANGKLLEYRLEEESIPTLLGEVPIQTTGQLSMLCIDKTHLFIAGITNSQGKHETCLWDLKYSSQKARKVLPSGISFVGKLCVADGNVYVPCQTGIISLEYRLMTPRLADIVGKNIGTTSSVINVVSWQDMDTASEAKVKSERVDSGSKCTSQSYTILASDKIHSIIEADDIKKLDKYLNTCPLVTEADLTSILIFIMNKKECLNESQTSNGPFSRKASLFINKILGMHFSNTLLIRHLKGMSFCESLLLLQHLDHLLFSGANELPDTLSAAKLMDWITMILDSHLNQLMLTTDSKVLAYLTDFYSRVQDEYNLCKDALKLDRLVSNVQKKCVLPKAPTNALYSIHVLQF